MDLLTLEEVAELEKVDYQVIKKRLQRGTLEYVEIKGIGQGGKQKRIPITALRESLQIKYYEKKLKENENLIPEDLRPKPIDKSKWKRFEEFSATEREEIIYWKKLLEDWQRFRDLEENQDKRKDELDKEFSNSWNILNPKHKISPSTLKRRWKLWHEKGDEALCENRGKSNKGRSKIDDVTWAIFQQYYLTQSQFDVTVAYDLTYEALLKDRQDLLPMASVRTFQRKVHTIPKTALIYGRKGKKALRDNATPYLMRDYSTIDSNDIWVADNHTLDIMVREEGKVKPYRVYLTAYQDVRSRKIVGRYLTTTPNSDSNLICLKQAIQKYGIPKEIYTDNGKEFLVHDIGGRGVRKTSDGFQVPTILERLDIKFTTAIVHNARAKGIERAFREVKNNFSKLFKTYTGGHVLERPEILKTNIKNSKNIVAESDLSIYLYDYIDYIYNEKPQNGNSMDNKSPNIVYSENLVTKRVATDEELTLMMLRSTKPRKVGRDGAIFELQGKKLVYWNSKLIQNYQGQQVYLRYDPEDMGKVRVYDLEDRFLCIAENRPALEYGASKEDISEAMKAIRKEEKIAKEYKKSLSNIYDAPTALEMTMEKIKRAKENPTEINPKILEIKHADKQEFEPLLTGTSDTEFSGIDLSRMVRNSKYRKEDE